MSSSYFYVILLALSLVACSSVREPASNTWDPETERQAEQAWDLKPQMESRY